MVEILEGSSVAEELGSFLHFHWTTEGQTDWMSSPLFKVIEFFLKNGFNVNEADSINGNTILHYLALLGGPMEFIRWLVVDKHADLNKRHSIRYQSCDALGLYLSSGIKWVTRRYIQPLSSTCISARSSWFPSEQT